MENDQYEVFEDRTKFLLERWHKFKVEHSTVQNIDAKSIKGFLAEVNDEYTKQLIRDAEKPEISKEDYVFYEWLILSKGMNEAEFKKLTMQEFNALHAEYTKYERSLN